MEPKIASCTACLLHMYSQTPVIVGKYQGSKGKACFPNRSVAKLTNALSHHLPSSQDSE